MNIRNTEIEIRRIAQNERGAEEETDGQDGAQEHIFRDVHILRTVNEVRCPLQHSRADGLYKWGTSWISICVQLIVAINGVCQERRS